MTIQDIIAKKADKQILNKEEIEYFVQKYTSGEITDYQASALIMAIYINGMNIKEITNLTIAMANSGDILDLSGIGKSVIDKHSTGGVGDKITLILSPIIASLGVPVAKMSGRGLGITGGTKDKLESIPGYKTDLSKEEFINNVKQIGISLIGQTKNLAPADKKIYSLRDTINCTQSIALIASSIMSKKIASGADKIVIDVTYGSGAFMKNLADAKKLAKVITEIGKLVKRQTKCVLTKMDEPLGYAVGNSLEIIESVKALKGNMPKDIEDVIIKLGHEILQLENISNNVKKSKSLIMQNIQNGKAYDKFIQLVEKQGGDVSYIENLNKFKKAKYIQEVKSDKDFIIKSIDAGKIGTLSVYLGAGRAKKEDSIEYEVGIVLNKKVGDRVNKGEILAYVHANSEEKAKYAVEELKIIYK